jgi:hypothetical protein
VGAVLGPNLGAPGEIVSDWLGLRPLAGSFVLATLVLLTAATLVLVLLRPDPLLLARDLREDVADAPPPRLAVRAGVAAILGSARARLAFLTMVTGHAAMVGVMTMTPVHMNHHSSPLSVIGLVISVHVLGMYALAPVIGRLADRYGPIPSLVDWRWGGDADTVAVSVGLLLLGLGWSCTTVAGGTLLADSVPAEVRPLVQGVADAGMNAVAACIAVAAGFVMAAVGFGTMALLALLLIVPVVAVLVQGRRDW